MVDITSSFELNVTMISNEFIDQYMSMANGEYIKEYLYVLRHQGSPVTVSMIADALNHTESDVARALSYWKKAGVLKDSGVPVQRDDVRRDTAQREITQRETMQRDGMQSNGQPGAMMQSNGQAGAMMQSNGQPGAMMQSNGQPGAVMQRGAQSGAAEQRDLYSKDTTQHAEQESACAKSGFSSSVTVAAERTKYTPDQMAHLSGDEDFSQLLYIAQKYMNKVFTQRECEVFAYLYEGLSMNAELLEYLVEYCVQGGHSSIRYIETVAINWHEKGFGTVDEAKSFASSFTKDSYAVMKAFGLNDRRPGDSEREMIERWFSTYGFARELVLEACNRTMESTHTPSFKYADKILSGWKQAGVRTLKDVNLLDERRAGAGRAKTQEAKAQEPRNGAPGRNRTSQNQFQNFPQREIDYDALVLDQLTEGS